MSIVRGPNPTKNFTMLHNAVIRDPRISWRARGILLFLLSQPEGYRVRSEQLAEMSKEGRDAVRTALKELEDVTYLVRIKTKRDNGTFEHDAVIHSYPQDPKHQGLEIRPWLDQVKQHENAGGTRAWKSDAGFSGPLISTNESIKRRDSTKENFTNPYEDQARAAKAIRERYHPQPYVKPSAPTPIGEWKEALKRATKGA